MAHPPVIQRLIDAYHKNTGKKRRNTEFSRKWFKDRISKNIKNVRLPQMVTEKNRNKSKPVIGKMYMYVYDAKHKDILPYYDAQPLIFIFNMKGKHFWGINLHYLPMKLRLVLFTELLKIRTNKRYRADTKLKLSWEVLERFSNFALVQPATKQYLFSQVRTKFIEVPADEWEIVLSLPLARWKGASQAKVWKDSIEKSRRKIRA